MSQSILSYLNRNDFDTVLHLITKENINKPLSEDKTILHLCILQNAPIEIIISLLQKGANPNITTTNDFLDGIYETIRNPLLDALKMQREDIVKELIRYRAKIQDTDTTESIYDLLMENIQQDNKYLTYFFKAGLNFNFIDNKNNQTLLHYACKNVNEYMIKGLLEIKEININQRNNNNLTALELLVRNAYLDKNKILTIFQYIINLSKKKQIDFVNNDNEHILFDILKYSRNLNPYFELENPLKKQHIDFIQLFLSNNIDINIINNENQSLLHWAVFNKEPDTIKFLLNNKIDSLIKDSNNKTALDYCNYMFPEAINLFTSPNDKTTLTNCYNRLMIEDKIFEFYINNEENKIEDIIKHYDINSYNRHFNGRILDYICEDLYSITSYKFINKLLKYGATLELPIINMYKPKKERNLNAFQIALKNFHPNFDMKIMYTFLLNVKNTNIVDKNGNNFLMSLLIKSHSIIDDKKMEEYLSFLIQKISFNFKHKNNYNQSFFDLLDDFYPKLSINYQKYNPFPTSRKFGM